ncbi:MAG: hypothetical protein JNK60_06760, partial [Acidobacteria bacterium]|nr:hypothetical protein [Acidobacteriota bacterium]
TAVLSHDGRLLAYESDELDGLVQVHVAAFPGGDQKVRASANGVRWPAFAKDGTLFFWDTTVLRLSSVVTRVEGGTLAVSGEGPVFPGEGAPDFSTLMLSGTARYDVPPPADRFLVLERHVVSVTKPFARPVLLLGLRNPMRPT